VLYLDADTTTDAESLRDGCNFVSWRHFNAELAHPDNRARFLALLPASLGLALVRVDDGYPCELVSLLKGFLPRHCHFDVASCNQLKRETLMSSLIQLNR